MYSYVQSTTRECGATEATIEIERKKLEDLQALLFQDFRRDLLEMLKRKGDKVTELLSLNLKNIQSCECMD